MWLFVSVFSAYADDTTLFFKNVAYVTEIVAMIDYFQSFGIKIKHLKMWSRRYWSSERGSYDCLSFKNCWLDIKYSQNIKSSLFYVIKIFRIKKDFCKVIQNIQNTFKIFSNYWGSKNVTIERKITIFKTLALSKVVYLDSCSQSNNRWTDKVPTNVI